MTFNVDEEFCRVISVHKDRHAIRKLKNKRLVVGVTSQREGEKKNALGIGKSVMTGVKS